MNSDDGWRTARCEHPVDGGRCANPVRYRIGYGGQASSELVCGVHRRMLLRLYGYEQREEWAVPPTVQQVQA